MIECGKYSGMCLLASRGVGTSYFAAKWCSAGGKGGGGTGAVGRNLHDRRGETIESHVNPGGSSDGRCSSRDRGGGCVREVKIFGLIYTCSF